MGIGGGGINAVSRMAQDELRGVEFVAIDSDPEALQAFDANLGARIEIDEQGLSSNGGSRDEIEAALKGADMTFITCGEGGGTGTGAAPVIAEIAKQEIGALTVGAVTKPFEYEGKKRMAQADEGIELLLEQTDCTIVLPAEGILELAEARMTILEGFRRADDLLAVSVKSIVDLITIPGLINLDFADVQLVMSQAGSALIGMGTAGGENRTTEAAKEAIASPLIEEGVDGAKSMIINVTGGEDLGLFEVNEAVRTCLQTADPEANVIFGAVIDDELADVVQVTVIATGLGSGPFVGGSGLPPEEPDAPAPVPRSPTPSGPALPDVIDPRGR